jgi:hypothetical protein
MTNETVVLRREDRIRKPTLNVSTISHEYSHTSKRYPRPKPTRHIVRKRVIGTYADETLLMYRRVAVNRVKKTSRCRTKTTINL